ncbi:hypothetical protein Pelo_2970 [Pelomyxa schiedti]|nr:hypothetical protein Pelo_2970 [Pelomyxa schiedti]
MAWWSITGACSSCVARVTATTTTRAQLGAVAAGATIPRCGARCPMVLAMGHGPAAWLVGSLWRDLVRPTLRTLRLDAFTEHFPFSLAVTVSPLLLGAVPGSPPDPSPSLAFSWVRPTPVGSDSAVTVRRNPAGGPSAGDWVLATRDTRTYLQVPVARVPLGAAHVNLLCPPDWSVTAVLQASRRPHVTLAVAPLRSAPLRGHEEEERRLVHVEVPQFTEPDGIRIYPDHSVCSEVALTQSSCNKMVILIVDVAETHRSKSLAVLSTTRCEFPDHYSVESLVVMRNWDSCSPDRHGSRTFIVKTRRNMPTRKAFPTYEAFHVQECTAASTSIKRHVVDAFRVSDSLFCVSYRTNTDLEWFNLYHRDSPARPLEVVHPSLKIKGNRKSHDRQSVVARSSMAHSGFVFIAWNNAIDVIEPTTGFKCLTLKLVLFYPVKLTLAVFSCFSSCS